MPSMIETAEYLSCAETASYLRAALKAAFPTVKFSVRSKTYSGGASISVGWTDGPSAKTVEPVAQRFAGATFDGMIDLKSHHDSTLTLPDGSTKRVSFGADFVFTNRSISNFEGQAAEASALILANCGGITGEGTSARWGDRWISDLSRATVYGREDGETLEQAFRRVVLREEPVVSA